MSDDLAYQPLLPDDLPDGDVIRHLLLQHERIRELFLDVRSSQADLQQQAFDQLRTMLAVHETAEEMVLRPVSRSAAGADVVDARNEEEQEATRLLSELERLDVGSAEFRDLLAQLEQAVLAHAAAEERAEFPRVVERCDVEQRRSMGEQLVAAERIAPTHPHTSTAGSTAGQWVAGPFISLVDRTRDALRSSQG